MVKAYAQIVHPRAFTKGAGVKGSRACEEKYPKTLQIFSEIGKALHHQGSL